ncbi:MAG: DUF3999 family protein [Armatimonadetes bacterium]|nr:DUF3999 family protein [Armatimonadota bacterium]
MHRRLTITLVFLIALSGSAQADFNPRNWARYSPVEAPKGASGQYAQVALDRDVYSGSNLDLSDVRVVRGKDQEVAYKLLVDEGRTSDTEYSATMLNESLVPGKYSSFVLDLGKPGVLSNRVEIQTSSANFMRKVEIDAASDGVNWAVLRNDAYIFDFSRDYHSRSTAVTYPDSTYRYIRVKVWNYGEKPLTIDGALVSRRKTEPAREEVLYKGMGTVSQNSEEKSTDVELDLGASGLPASKDVITSSSTNYHRWVEIAGSIDRKEWIDLCSSQILKYDTPKFKGEESSIPCSGRGYRYMRVRIRNYDDQPITITGIKVYGARKRFFFPYRTGASYRLYYGNSEAGLPTYDIEETFKYLSAEKAIVLRLGPGVKNPDFVMPIATKPWFEKNPWILWVVLLAAVILLGLLTIRSIIQTKAAPPPQ